MAPSIALPRPSPAVAAAVERFAPLVLLGIAVALLVAAEFSTLREIKAVTAVPEGGLTSGGSHHGYALLVISGAALVMAFGAWRGGSRPAAVAVAALGAAALAIVLLIDLPSLDDTGLIGRNYDLAEAHPSTGFWLELAGAVLLVASGLLLLRATRPEPRRRPPRDRAAGDRAAGDDHARAQVTES